MQIRYPFPENPEDFVSLCLRLYRKHWNVPNLQKYGRRGHSQSGTDLLGTDDQGRMCLVQCKHRDFHRSLSDKEVRDEVESVKNFETKVDRFVIATTAKRDPDFQNLAAAITQDHAQLGLFSVEIDSWDDLVEILNEHSEVADTVYGGFRTPTAPEPSEARKFTSCSLVHSPPTARLVEPLTAGEPEDIHAEISEAGSYMEKGDLTVAEVLLDRIEKRHGARFTPRCWYRIYANRGHIRRLRGQFPEAARLYLQARDYQPDDPAARWMAGIGIAMTGELSKAEEAAKALVADHPGYARGWALLVSIASDRTPFEQIESQVAPAMRDDAEVALNLASKAAAQDSWLDCERYARKALAAFPGWRDAKIQLAVALIAHGQREAVRASEPAVVTQLRHRIGEARDLLRGAIDDAPDYQPKGESAALRLNLAAAYELLDEPREAEKLVNAGYSIAPEDAEARRAYAIHLLQQGNPDGAVDVLAKDGEAGRVSRIALLLAQVLAQRNRGEDQKNAIGILDLDPIRAEQLAKEPPGFRSDWVCTLLVLRIAQGQVAGMDAFLDTLPADALRSEEKAAFKAACALESGDDAGATSLADQASERVTQETHPLAVRQLALILRRLGSFEKATVALRTMVPLVRVDDDTGLLFDSAQRANRLDLVLEYSERLRSNGCLNPKYIRNEVALLSQVSPLKAIDLLLGLLRDLKDEVLKRECRAVLSRLARTVGKHELVETSLQDLPRIAELSDARVGLVVVDVLRHGPKPMDGVTYAYELYRRFPGELDAHMAVVSSFNMDTGRTIDLDVPQVASPGAGVRYREEDSGQEHWLIIEDGDRPDASRDEHAPSEPICAAITGKSKGEQFQLREHPPRTGTLLDVISKYLYRFHQCLSNMETRFSGRAPVWEFHLPKSADGKPDPVKFIEQLKAICGRDERVLEVYRSQPVPLHMVAAVEGATVYQVAQQVAYDPKTKLRCCVGSRQESENAFAAMRTSNAVVLDTTAVSTLALLEAQGVCKVADVLGCLPWKPIISEHVLLELQRLQDFRFGRNGEQMFVGATGDQLYRQTLSAEEMRKAREQLQQLRETLCQWCSVEHGIDLARYLAGDRELLSILGHPGFHATLLAAKPGRALWTDDLVAAQLAAERFAVKRIWTQATLLWLESTGRIAKAVQQDASLVLVRAGYVFTGLNRDHILRAGDQESWDPGSPRFAVVLEQFANSSINPPSRLALANACLKSIWQRGLVSSRTTAVTFRILELLDSDSDGRAVIEAIHRGADQIFGLDVINAQALKQTIAAWKTSRRKIIRP